MLKQLPKTEFKNFFELLGLVRELSKDFVMTVHPYFEQHGKTFTFVINGSHEIMTKDPKFAHEVLVKQAAHFQKPADYTNSVSGLARFFGSGLLTSNGEFWKRQRKLVAPALHVKRIANYADTMVDFTTKQMTQWADGKQISVVNEMNAITMQIIAKTMFNAEVQQDITNLQSALGKVQDFMLDNQTALIKLPGWMPTLPRYRADTANNTLNEFIYRTINDWKKVGEDKGDLLSMLLLARDEDGNPMSDQQARDEALTLFLAGFETTANTLNWTWYLLAKHPLIAKKLHAELDSVLQGRTPTLEDLKNLSYTANVIKESMRLYPPAYNYGRQATQDVVIDGYEIPAGANVTVWSYHMHHDPDLWQDPEAFIPERWEDESALPENAYLPFGNGPRVCIGNAFASMEANLLLATIASRFELHLDPSITVGMKAAITLNPNNLLPMTLKARQPIQEPHMA
jgi:cytochrome P450